MTGRHHLAEQIRHVDTTVYDVDNTVRHADTPQQTDDVLPQTAPGHSPLARWYDERRAADPAAGHLLLGADNRPVVYHRRGQPVDHAFSAVGSTSRARPADRHAG